MHARELLVETVAHISPPNAIEGLRADDAERRVEGAPHSIAEIVAHMNFWQEWWYRRCKGEHAPMVAEARLAWPAVTAGSWPELHDAFVAGQERLLTIGDRDGLIAPPIEFPPLAQYTIHDGIVHVAQHNGYHLGQVVTLRQVIGLWPPPSGAYTW